VASLPVDRPLSARSGRVKTARRLARRNSRAEQRLFLAEGAKALTEALHAGGVVEVFATLESSEQYAALRKAVDDSGIPWSLAEDDAIAALSGAVTPQGIVATCRFLDVPLSSVVEERGTSVSKPQVLAICADVRDPGNAGTVIRCADASGAQGVVLAGNSVDPYNDKTVRATVGSLWHVPLSVHDDPADAVRRVQAAGFVVLAADGAGETDLFDAEKSGLLAGRVAWLFGNESWGLPDELGALADHRVSIPIYGRAESLNLSTAAAVCLYATARARR
jgi:TrmH family RNA methyltransferase